jgi:hypothetical protein
MTSKRSRDVGDVPPRADDFTLVRGIGPSIAQRLHGAGIRTFAQLAAQSPDDIAALLANVAGVTAERIVKQNWIGQARDLAAELAPAESAGDEAEQTLVKPHDNASGSAARQHYATFTVELLLSESNDVRRTRVVHVQGGEEDAWAGWDDKQLVNFVIQRAGLRLSMVEPAPAAAIVEPALPVSTPEPVRPVTMAVEPAPLSAMPAGITGSIRLRALETVPEDNGGVYPMLRHGHPFRVHLTLDLTDVKAPRDVPLGYTTVIYAKKMGLGARHIIGEARGTFILADTVTIDVKATALPEGPYRLEATVALTLPAAEPPPQPGLIVLMEGGLTQVY